MLTRESVEKALPPSLKSAATQALTDKINNITKDPVVAEHIRENFISYARILQEGKFKTEDYLHAVAYVSYKHMGYSNQSAYEKTFPQRHATLIANGTSPKDISAYVASYHRGKLVNLIMEQSLVPIWIVNQESYQRAINTQVEIMEDKALPAVARTAAANSILTHLAKPKEAAAAVQINLAETSGMSELKSMLTQLATNQRNAIQGGLTPKDIANQRIIDVEPEDVPS